MLSNAVVQLRAMTTVEFLEETTLQCSFTSGHAYVVMAELSELPVGFLTALLLTKPSYA